MRDQSWQDKAAQSRESIIKGHRVPPPTPKPVTFPRVTLGQLQERVRALARNPVYVNDGTVALLWGWLDAGEYARVGWWFDHGQHPIKERARFMGPRASIQSIRKRRG